MNVWKKLFKAIKGTVNNAAESVADGNALTILDQEIREAKAEIRRADESLVSIIAKRKMAEKRVSDIKNSITEYEGYARSAAGKGDNGLALECAQKVATLRDELEREQALFESFQKAETTHRHNVQEAKKKVSQLENQVDLVKATEQVQKAQAATQSSVVGASSKTSTALDSLERIKSRQAEKAAQFEAQQELHDSMTSGDLDKKLKEAGITSSAMSAEDELARILGK
ncbi:phage shock protein A (IM30), suppresses sigma54-dependent transcription [Photorhabdus luminescens subsp. luminescens]|uniref:Phage shock protein A (PspA) family protein n=1 Tax=Photorhabdus luminescens TaxID=29488 RepID=A0A1G5REU9_PHOLU|nr:PspA/IM30 family protein [Photorhabdus luminescens]KMW73185.1 phage shock protein A (IM30), suppresses sigma54-dependent transcription [Photorhabdus luminescens subsp. luminescens]SCZ72557.1 phage shock protein A (PspA) family protein [Photorhabdus luminescens]